MSAYHRVTIVFTRQPGGLWRAESGLAWADSTTPELAARQLGGLLLDVTPDRIALTRLGARLYQARVRGERAKLVWRIVSPLALGTAAAVALYRLIGGGS